MQNGTYDKWALDMSDKFNKDGISGTPTLKMDGKTLTGPDGKSAPMTVADFNTALASALKG
ncbi:Disulfide bond formation protein DsbA OS=Streptomyces griseorubiginosus OX=67304 GN=AQJ54_11055 PE=4 SV=1 [Streptomyces griseorubiginosus]